VKAGDVLEGKYRLASLLGRGGMGSVWRADDLTGGAPVAVKLMHPGVAASAGGRERFEREAAAAARLCSPHVIRVLGLGVDPTLGACFIAMELLEGETLKQRLLRAPSLAPLEVAQLVSQVACALEQAHAAGLVHRDLKPANVFLVAAGHALSVKVLDFGVAKWLSLSRDRALATTTNRMLGTPHYMSPEQIESSKDVDFRSDLWSLGVLAFECMTGKLPFESKRLSDLAFLITQGAATRPSALTSVPLGFDEWFERATAARRPQRFPSASYMASELERLCAAGALTGEPGERLLGGTTRQSRSTSRKDVSRP
jgi:serine/threonine-protein kinase